MTINEQYSYKDFLNVSLESVPVMELNDSEIISSCFYQEWLGGATLKDIFPIGMTGVIFIDCNLDNVLVRPGNTLQNSTNKHIRVQNDLGLWICDNQDNPIEPVAKEIYELNGHSIQPESIPEKFVRRERLAQKEFERIQNELDFTRWWEQTPSIILQETAECITRVNRELWEASALKDKWTQDFDAIPQIIVEKDKVTLKGQKTFIIIEGNGQFFIPGIEPRPMLNRCEGTKIGKK